MPRMPTCAGRCVLAGLARAALPGIERFAQAVTQHILPNALPPILVLATLGFSTAILSAAALSFLGLGAQPPEPEWGLELALGRDLMRQAWWIMTFPGLAIAITVLGFNLLGDGLREALDPRQRRSG